MAYKHDVQAQNWIPCGYHATGFQVQRSSLKKQSKDDKLGYALSICHCEKDSGCAWAEEAKG